MRPTNPRVSLKTRWLMLRASVSAPALLARFDERRVLSWMSAVNGGLAIATISVFAWFCDLPLVFPALGPTAFILFSSPMAPSAAPRSVILGHFSCLACGYAVWHFTSYLNGSPVSIESGGWLLFCSASLTLAFSCLLLIRLSCPHPPACASAMVVGLGAVTHWQDLLLMGLVVAWVTFQAVAMNRFAGLPVSTWSFREREIQ